MQLALFKLNGDGLSQLDVWQRDKAILRERQVKVDDGKSQYGSNYLLVCWIPLPKKPSDIDGNTSTETSTGSTTSTEHIEESKPDS